MTDALQIDLMDNGLPPGARCGNCRHGRLTPDPTGKLDLQKRTCFQGPPGSVPLPQFKRGMQGQEVVGFQMLTVFPTLEINQVCHQWEAPRKGSQTQADQASLLATGTKAS